MRTTIGCVLAMTLAAGCGQGAGDDGSGGDASTTASAGGGGAGGADGATSSSTDSSTAGGAGGDGQGGEAGHGGAPAGCGRPAGVPDVEQVVAFGEDGHFAGMSVHDGVLAHGWGEGYEPSTYHVSRMRLEDRAPVEPSLFLGNSWLWALAQAGDQLVATGHCLGASPDHPTGGTVVRLFGDEGDIVPVNACPGDWMGAVAATDDAVYAVSGSRLLRVPLTGAPETTILFEHETTSGFADVVIDGDVAFAVMPGSAAGGVAGPGELWRIAVDGSSAEIVHETPVHPVAGGGVLEPGPLSAFVDETFLYFQDAADGIIARVPKTGGEAEVLGHVWSPYAIARSGDRIVYLSGSDETDCGTVVGSIPIEGGDVTEHGWLDSPLGELHVHDGVAYVGGWDGVENAGIFSVVIR